MKLEEEAISHITSQQYAQNISYPICIMSKHEKKEGTMKPREDLKTGLIAYTVIPFNLDSVT